MKNIKKILVIFFVVFCGWQIVVAHGQETSGQGVSAPLAINDNKSTVNQYDVDCKKFKLDCYIGYGQADDKEDKEPERNMPQQRVSNSSSSQPMIVGPTSFIIVLVLLVGGILLWMRFGGSGVLLSAAPKEIEAQTQVPENWGKSSDIGSHKKDDILSRILAMEDRRVALVELLRMCLLHGATISSTRLARSDTERTVIRRFPKELPQRSDLEFLLKTTELVRYGGQDISDDQFDLLIDKARNFLNIRKMAHA